MSEAINKIRVIPRLDVKGTNLVKGVHLEGLRVLGLPFEFAMLYYQGGADELLYMDTVASLFGRNNLHDIVKKTAANVYIPMTVGGGVRSVDDVRGLLNAGADKVAINTALFANPELVSRVADAFGTQCMVVSIEAVKVADGRYECLTDNGREKTGVDVFEWVDRVVGMGAGEILLTSVDREGTGHGYDMELVEAVARQAPIPVIASGGAGKRQHVVDVIKQAGADAVAVASILHYDLVGRVSHDESSGEGNLDFKKRTGGMQEQLRKRIEPTSVEELKAEMVRNNIDTRMGDGGPR